MASGQSGTEMPHLDDEGNVCDDVGTPLSGLQWEALSFWGGFSELLMRHPTVRFTVGQVVPFTCDGIPARFVFVEPGLANFELDDEPT